MRLAIFLLFLALPLSAAEKPKSITLRNDAFGFEVTIPATWAVQKVEQDDLDTALDSGTTVMSLGGAGDLVANPNGFQCNGVQMSMDPLPTITVYAHKKPSQDAAALAAIIQAHLKRWEAKPAVMNASYKLHGMNGLEVEYDIFVPTRIVALFHEGTRYVFHYFVPAGDPRWFRKYKPAFEKVVQSFKLTTTTPAQ